MTVGIGSAQRIIPNVAVQVQTLGIIELRVRNRVFLRAPVRVSFEQNETAVLVEVLPSGDEIELRARGPENKALLSVISADLDALNDSFMGLRDKVEKRIPCYCKLCSAATSPSFFSYRELVRRKEHGKRRRPKRKVNCSSVSAEYALQVHSGREVLSL